MIFIRISLILLCVGFCAGCHTAPKQDYTPMRAAFYLESAGDRAAQVTLPVSGLALSLHPRPVITEFDLAKVEVVKAEFGAGLMFHLTTAAKRDVYRLTAANQGGRLVLLINGVAVGARRIDRPIEEGAILMFVEKTDGDLPVLARNLQLTSAALQHEMADK